MGPGLQHRLYRTCFPAVVRSVTLPRPLLNPVRPRSALAQQRFHVVATLAALVVAAAAVVSPARALEDLELPSDISVAMPQEAPLGGPVDDDRVWEDVSFGTGEADFTAVAVAPDNPRQLYVGAGGSVFVSTDAGNTWRRVLDVRGGARGASSFSRSREAGDAESEFDDRFQELREEALEEARREIIDDLIAELGDAGEKLAEELAEELAEQRIDEDEDRLREEAMDDVRRRNQGRDAPLSSSVRTQNQTPSSSSPSRRVHRILALPGGRVFAATAAGLYIGTIDGEQASFEHMAIGTGDDVEVLSVAAHPAAPGVIFAGTRNGLWSSDDAGAHWAQLGDLPLRTEVVGLAPHPQSPKVMLVATSNGVYRTTDQGSTFVPVLQPNASTARDVRAVAFDIVDPRVAFAGTQEGVFRSLDGGFAWERLETTGLITRQVSDLASADWGLAVATVNGVFFSPDAGASFRELFAGLEERDVRRIAAGVTPLSLWSATGRGTFSYRAPVERARRQAALAEIKALIAREPTIPEVSRAVLANGFVADKYSAIRRRAELASFVPRLTVRYGGLNPWGDYRQARTLFLDPVPNQAVLPPVLYDTSRESNAFQVLFVWGGSRWAFDPAELDTMATFRRVEGLRSKLLRRVVSVYDARRRLQVALLMSPPDDLRSLAFKNIQVEELTGVLDALSNGYFSAALAAADARPADAKLTGSTRSR